jgi:hypothetical protein
MNSIIKPTHPDNIGSIIKLWFVPLGEIANMSRPVNDYGGITLKTGSLWHEFYFSPQSGLYKFEMKSDYKGSFFKSIISGSSPRLGPDLSIALSKLRGASFVCKILDANGFYRIVGNTDFPLNFSFDGSTGSAPGDKNGIHFSFLGFSRYAPFFITSSPGSD